MSLSALNKNFIKQTKMRKILLLLAILMLNLGYSQVQYEYGDTFEFDTKNEMDPQFVLKDNYNHYLLTVVVVDGMMAKRQMIVRKFDQKNQMLEKFVYDFPSFDIATLYNYLGYTETNGKVAVFTQTYSNKAKKSVVSVHVFDKATNKFTTTEITSTAIPSAMKSGTVFLDKSHNNRYVAIAHAMHRAKKEPEKNMVTVFDAQALTTVWQKELTYTDEHTTNDVVATNSGSAVLVRANKSFKKELNNSYLVVATTSGEENKTFESQTFLQSPESISIGTQDYLVAFSSDGRGLRQLDFSHLMFYDLKSGSTLQNNKILDFVNIKEIQDATIRSIEMQNNEIYVFTEAKVEAGTRPATGMSSFPETIYANGPAYMYTLGMDGALKSTKQLNISTAEANLYQSYGLLNIKGNYYVQTGIYKSMPDRYPGIYDLKSSIDNKTNSYKFSPFANDQDMRYNTKYVNQLMAYFPDSKRMLVARIVNGKDMSLVNVTGVE
jgi:hypothetical protein